MSLAATDVVTVTWFARRAIRRAAPVRRAPGGFTLLEIMAALAILALTLIVLINIITQNLRSTAHARLTTTATFLARGKMVSIEDKIIEIGFQELDEFEEGTFKDEDHPEFSWEMNIEKVSLPTDLGQDVQQQAGNTMKSNDPMQVMTGFMGGLLGGFIEPIRVGLEESVRRVTLKVFWAERGKPEQSLDVVTYVTDPAKLDIALALGAAGAGAGVPGATGSGTTGAATTGSSATGTKK